MENEEPVLLTIKLSREEANFIQEILRLASRNQSVADYFTILIRTHLMAVRSELCRLMETWTFSQRLATDRGSKTE
jgi:hypothetical protein